VAMQATREERHTVHRCARCGTVMMVALPANENGRKNPTMFNE